MQQSAAGEGWYPLKEDEERDLLMNESREATRQTLTLIGIIVGLVALSLVPAAKRYDALLMDSVKSPWSFIGALIAVLVLLGLAYLAWLAIVGGVAVQLIYFDGEHATRISMVRLRKGLKSTYFARLGAIVALFLWPVLLVINFVITLAPCAHSTLCN